jgi:two-component system chemotaxis sensor kinase CheA
MEHIRSLGLVASLEKLCTISSHIPENLDEDSACSYIVENGFTVLVRTCENPDVLRKLLNETLFTQTYSVIPIEEESEPPAAPRPGREMKSTTAIQSMNDPNSAECSPNKTSSA